MVATEAINNKTLEVTKEIEDLADKVNNRNSRLYCADITRIPIVAHLVINAHSLTDKKSSDR